MKDASIAVKSMSDAVQASMSRDLPNMTVGAMRNMVAAQEANVFHQRQQVTPANPQIHPIEVQVKQLSETGAKLDEAMTALGREVTSMLEATSIEGSNILDKLEKLRAAVADTHARVTETKEEMRKYFERVSGEVLAATEIARRFSAQCDSMKRDVAG